MLVSPYAAPHLTSRFWPVVMRNLLVWKKLAGPSVLGNIAEPLITLVAFGYGVGALIGAIGGVPYIQFLASGSVPASAALAATLPEARNWMYGMPPMSPIRAPTP